MPPLDVRTVSTIPLMVSFQLDAVSKGNLDRPQHAEMVHPNPDLAQMGAGCTFIWNSQRERGCWPVSLGFMPGGALAAHDCFATEKSNTSRKGEQEASIASCNRILRLLAHQNTGRDFTSASLHFVHPW
jgi:hypothetical protein